MLKAFNNLRAIASYITLRPVNQKLSVILSVNFYNFLFDLV